MSPQWRFNAERSRRERLEKTRHREGIITRPADLAEQHTQSLFDALVMHRRPIPDPPSLAAAFSRDPVWLDKTTRTSASIAEWAAADHARSLKERRTTEYHEYSAGITGEPRRSRPKTDWNTEFVTAHSFLEYRQPEDGILEVFFRRVIWQGTIRNTTRLKVTEVRENGQHCYRTQLRTLTQADADQWINAFLNTLAEPECPDLERFFHDFLIDQEVRLLVVSATEMISSLRAERRRWQSLRFTAAAPLPLPIPGPGGRWLLQPRLHQTGVRPVGGVSLANTAFAPLIDIAWIGDAWRIVRFTF